MLNRLFRTYWVVALLLLVSASSCKPQKQVVQAPVPPPVKTEVQKKPELPAAPAPRRIPARLRIAIVMPFELEQNFNPDTADGAVTEMDVTPGSIPAIHFYEGAKLAVDSLTKDSISVSLSSFDAPGDSAATARLFGGPMLRDFDYVIAGIQPALATVAASAAQRSGIRLILSQAPTVSILDGHPNVALAGASTFTQCRETAIRLSTLYPSAHFIVVSRKLKREHELAAVFSAALKAQTTLPPVYEFDATTRPTEEIKKHLRAEKRNIIIIASSDEAFVKNAVNAINEMEMAGIYVCGLPTWSGFESIDYMSLENLKFFLFDNNYSDASDPGVSAFRKLFIREYSSDPLPQGFNGFDLVYGLGADTVRTGDLCERLLRAFAQSDRYRFLSSGPGNGCENASVTLLEIDDYSMKKVR